MQKPSLVKSSTGAKKKEKGKSSQTTKKSAASGSHVRIGEEDFLGEEEREKSSMDADLTLRASLYGVLFQAYSDTVSKRLSRDGVTGRVGGEGGGIDTTKSYESVLYSADSAFLTLIRQTLR